MVRTADQRVKHLNPRQGITTTLRRASDDASATQCETPKSPPGDYNRDASSLANAIRLNICVKHLNPRQGITTRITTHPSRQIVLVVCETPKSPPGDYNCCRVMVVCRQMRWV